MSPVILMMTGWNASSAAVFWILWTARNVSAMPPWKALAASALATLHRRTLAPWYPFALVMAFWRATAARSVFGAIVRSLEEEDSSEENKSKYDNNEVGCHTFHVRTGHKEEAHDVGRHHRQGHHLDVLHHGRGPRAQPYTWVRSSEPLFLKLESSRVFKSQTRSSRVFGLELQIEPN